MAFRRGTRFRGRRSFRKKRSFRRRRFRKGRGSFKRAVRRVILRTAEAKQSITATQTGLGLTQGDGTSRIVYVTCPVQVPAQGDENDQFAGNKFFVKGISFRGQVGSSGENTTFQGALVRISLVWSKKQNASLAAGWNIFNSTTTRVANPAATAPNENPTFFEASTLTQQFVGRGWADAFDRTTITVLSSRTIVVNPGVENEAAAGVIALPTPFKFYYRINKWMQIEDPTHTDFSTAQFRFKNGTYYLVMQVVSNTNDVAATAVGEMDYTLKVHFRDP
ncbi:capsid protein [Peromfec virus RodF8_90]|uniref:Capsid protein n=1 Tax=Peromfec virus RodF8_90 TaxID=2929285 RepID=A0A976N1L0_9VIRU|nr:capsid protein [Peromfec virus RodF8_90]